MLVPAGAFSSVKASAEVTDSVKITWPDGTSEELKNVKANQTLELVLETRTKEVQK